MLVRMSDLSYLSNGGIKLYKHFKKMVVSYQGKRISIP